ncbi:microfibrillar-associated protein 1-like protein [Tanacetum coccineum]|uniref:Microfibrillar-associated protein 1-like protein n=1 Tax=Tanacetum coccineum TaxID=301880 RepID=A0ABQ5HP31_9ASTR
MSVTAAVYYSAIEVKGNIGQTKVKRYRPGKAPDWADDHAGDHEDNRDIQMSGSVMLEKGYDRRLSRLAENRLHDKEEIRADHRRIRQAEIVSNEEEEKMEVEEDDEDAVYERRRMLKEKSLQREQEEKVENIVEEDEEDEKEEEESEYETDSEAEQMDSMAMMKPVFVKKSERDTIAEREKMEAEERAIKEFIKMRVEERKVETKQMVVEVLRKDMEIQKNKETEGEVDTDDDENIFEAWIPREAARIKRDRRVRDAMVQEKEEIERVRNMTEEERKEWDRKNPKPHGAPKQKWKYMQRYYHRGAFFQDKPDDTAGTTGADGILQRDYSAPTSEDKMDRIRLPKIMQVKYFGRSGRTKWTHLVTEDTSDWNNPYALYPIF